jgi:hypothetical protein
LAPGGPSPHERGLPSPLAGGHSKHAMVEDWLTGRREVSPPAKLRTVPAAGAVMRRTQSARPGGISERAPRCSLPSSPDQRCGPIDRAAMGTADPDSGPSIGLSSWQPVQSYVKPRPVHGSARGFGLGAANMGPDMLDDLKRNIRVATNASLRLSGASLPLKSGRVPVVVPTRSHSPSCAKWAARGAYGG